MGRLRIGAAGRLAGSWAPGIAYNSPWPTRAGEWGSTEPYRGTILHTMVGNLGSYTGGTIALFQDPANEASAHFGVAQDGHIHQFGPVGQGWVAWHVMGGNYDWYGVEFADNGDPNNRYTEAQLDAAAAIVDAIHTHHRLPVQVTDSTTGRGIGCHYMGGAAWGGHSCPDATASPNHTRSRARAEVARRVQALRAPAEDDVKELIVLTEADLPLGGHAVSFGSHGATQIKIHANPEWHAPDDDGAVEIRVAIGPTPWQEHTAKPTWGHPAVYDFGGAAEVSLGRLAGTAAVTLEWW